MPPAKSALHRLLAVALPLALAAASTPTPARAERVSPVADRPDWSFLDLLQRTLTREQFAAALQRVYAPDGAAAGWIEIAPDAAAIRRSASGPAYRLEFAPSAAAAKPAPRYWRTPAELGPAPADRPLAGLRVAIDPGHIGGEFAKLEERWFQIGQDRPVVEGDMTLLVGKHLAAYLEALGAKATLVRDSAKPVTRRRPADFRKEAIRLLREQGVANPREKYRGPNDPEKQATVQWQSELLFYRADEIRQRARKVNDSIRPDLTVCLHFNAEAWGDPANPTLVDVNHLHLLLNGAVSRGELGFDDVRFEMILRLTQNLYGEELALAEAVSARLAAATALPPYSYGGGNARRAGANPFLWVRNLLANRLYLNPVLYLEPHVMNSREAYTRIQAGDYEGRRNVGGIPRESIFREYARAVAEGIADHCRKERARP